MSIDRQRKLWLLEKFLDIRKVEEQISVTQRDFSVSRHIVQSQTADFPRCTKIVLKNFANLWTCFRYFSFCTSFSFSRRCLSCFRYLALILQFSSFQCRPPSASFLWVCLSSFINGLAITFFSKVILTIQKVTFPKNSLISVKQDCFLVSGNNTKMVLKIFALSASLLSFSSQSINDKTFWTS